MATLSQKLEAKLAKEGLTNLSDAEIKRFAGQIGQEAAETLEGSALVKKFKEITSGNVDRGSARARISANPDSLPAVREAPTLDAEYIDPTAPAAAGPGTSVVPAAIQATPLVDNPRARIGATGSWGAPVGAAAVAGSAGVASSIGQDQQAAAAPASMLPADLRPADPAKPSAATGSGTAASLASAAQPAPDTVQARTVNPASIKPAAKIATPQVFADNLNAIKEQGAKFASNQGELYSEQDQAALNEWNQRREKLEADYAEAKDRVGWGEAAEIFGKALARIGAGLYGMRTGLDLSGAKFDISDWSSRYDRAANDYKIGLDQAEKATTAKRDSIESLRKEYKGWQDSVSRAGTDLGKAEFDTKRANQDIESDYMKLVTSVLQFNAKEQNDASKTNVEAVNRMREARVKAEVERATAQSPEEKLRFQAAGAGFAAELQRYEKNVQALANAKQKIAGSGTLSGKEQAKAYSTAIRDIPGEMLGGRDIWAEAEAAAKDTAKWWDGPEDYIGKLLDEVSKTPPPPPTIEQYMKSAGLQPSGGSSTQQPQASSAAAAPAANSKGAVTADDVTKYAEKWKITPQAAKDALTKLGYTTP